jgi:hypothetical protein
MTATTYTFDQLKEDVTKEAEALRVHATKDELSLLNIDELKPSNIARCIYGQMTGNCYSLRAATLINKCCVRFFRSEMMPTLFSHHTNMENIQKGVNGSTVRGFIKERSEVSSTAHFSAVEAYILLPEAKNANLIAYLKGETYNLEL